MTLKVITYNIQLSRNTEQLVENLSRFVKEGVSVFCLQEVLTRPDRPFIIDALLASLGKDWRAIYHIEDAPFEMGNAILWDSTKLTLQRETKFFLPQIDHLSFIEKTFLTLVGGRTNPLIRRSIMGEFLVGKQKIGITSIHLDHVGGPSHRLRQLRYFLQTVRKDPPAYEIVCGDFNSFDLLKTGKEKKGLKKTFGEQFVNATEVINWSADWARMDLDKGLPFVEALIKKSHIHIKRQLDYIWVKKASVTGCEMVMLPGSDHLPIIATVDFGKNS
ncbi:MAG: endonuclease/exonuclease/phosphatase family protein [Patescibacteria group bacterium]